MRRGRIWPLLLAAVLLTGCARESAPLPAGWEESWVRFDTLAAAETPEGFTLHENMDALAPNGIYYADWTAGEGRDFTGADGQTATAYDAQLYLLLSVCRDGEAAGEAAEEWIQRERENYDTGASYDAEAGGQAFTVLPLLSGREDNPYTHGAAAFAVRGPWAISAELLCGEAYTGDPEAALAAFLAGLHYGEE